MNLPKDTYLVQRLKAPPKKTGSPLDNAHRVFGGGMLGLSGEAWNILDEVFEIDYMGAAEYEFGILPKTLGDLYDNKDSYIAFSFVLKAKEIRPNFYREMDYRKIRSQELKAAKTEGRKPSRAKKLGAQQDRTVYVICKGVHKEGAIDSIRQLALGKTHTKGGTLFPEALDPVNERDSTRKGWLELNNGFFFFIDEEMWKKTCELFEVKIGE